MGLAPISPLAGALPWATTAIEEIFGAAFSVAVVGAIDIATAAPYIGNAADIAALDNIKNIVLYDIYKQYFVLISTRW